MRNFFQIQGVGRELVSLPAVALAKEGNQRLRNNAEVGKTIRDPANLLREALTS